MTRSINPLALAVYRAERRVWPAFAVDLPELADVRAYVAKVTRDRWFVRHFGAHAIEVLDGRGLRPATVARGGDGSITIRRRVRCRWVVLHELTHCLVSPARHEGHGPEFVRVYLSLVRHFLGRQARRNLKAAMRAEGVRMQHRRPRRVTAATFSRFATPAAPPTPTTEPTIQPERHEPERHTA